MRRVSWLLAAVLLLVGGAVSAQTSANDVATVNATVVSALTVTKVTDINFGIMNVSSTSTLTAATPSAGQTAGKFSAAGSNGSVVTVTWAVVQPTVGGNAATFTPAVSGNATDAVASATAVTSGSTVTLSGTGGYFFYVGGTFLAPATSGTATGGSFTLTLAY